MPTKAKPLCAGCGKPADPVRDRTTQDDVWLHEQCSHAITVNEGWNQIVRKPDLDAEKELTR